MSYKSMKQIHEKWNYLNRIFEIATIHSRTKKRIKFHRSTFQNIQLFISPCSSVKIYSSKIINGRKIEGKNKLDIG